MKGKIEFERAAPEIAPARLVGQTLNFRAPVRTGDRVVAKVRLMELYQAKRRARFACVCSVEGVVVLEGEAVLMVPARAAGKAA